jgi:protein tyrosine phosphatase (PTP) superfamily phosphohydrolase (DUF442 family)
MMIRFPQVAKHRAALLAAAIFGTALTGAVAFSSTPGRQASPPADAAVIITISGVSNAARVEGALYRGGQPSTAAYAELKKLGIDVIVDFQDSAKQIQSEKQQVEAGGMTFVSIPWSATKDPPREVIATFFTTLHNNPGKKIFVHCERGADRTGTMIALYRIAYDHWTADQAVAEMKAFHYWSILLPHLGRYVQTFVTTLAGDPTLVGQGLPATQP